MILFIYNYKRGEGIFCLVSEADDEMMLDK